MKFEDISAPRLFLRVKPTTPGTTLKEEEGVSVKTALMRGEFDVRTKDAVVSVTPIDAADINALTDVLKTGRATLARLIAPAPDGSGELQIVLFSGEPLEMGDLEIGVDEEVVRSTKEISKRVTTSEDAAKHLFGQSVLRFGGQTYFFMVAGEAAKEYLEAKPKQERKKAGKETPVENSEQPEDENDWGEATEEQPDHDERIVHRNFAILGADIRFALAEKDKGNGQTIFLASGITRIRNQREDPALRLACGNLKFLDWTAAGQRGILAKAQLDQLTKNDSSYLKKWDEFGNAEGKLFLERARDVGAISFTAKPGDKDGTVTVACGPLSELQKEKLRRIVELDATDDLPEFLDNPNMTFEEFMKGIVDKVEFLGEKKPEPKDKKSVWLPVEDFNPATGELCLGTDIAPSGKWLIYSIAGEVAQIKRRMNARQQILTGRAANPNLGLLIEENGQIPPCQPPPKMKPLTAFVRKKVFPENPPTPKQEDAIRVALNTPDIALIQGPPGTGKTTVIAAIIERLNEEADKRNEVRGRVLLSGFQHDAVENMIGRMSLNSLPVPKFGQRSGDNKNADLSRFDRQLKEWCEKRTKELRNRNPQIAELMEETDLRNLCVQYIKAPTLALAVNLLDLALKLPDRTLGEDLRKRLQAERRNISAEQQNTLAKTRKNLYVVRSLRVLAAGFFDDGPDRAADVLGEFKDELEDADHALLTHAQNWRKPEAPPFLKELNVLKGRLLMRFTPAPMFLMEKARDTVIALIKETVARLRSHGLSARDKKTAALAELLLEMENNPTGILETVSDYSFAFAATCQQSVNEFMQKMKGINPNAANQKMEYDFVIVDEAARVSPRDLMIPMAQGKRIILVGDHRQLPQLIDEAVAAEMEEGKETQDAESDWLKMSMFEYLFTERLSKLEEADGIQRRVTLDKQYRMHPMLGDFISRNFYEHFNAEEKFVSGRPESHFAHNLPGTGGKCAAWLDVHAKQGKMMRSGTSWTRPAEADAICAKLKTWMDCPEGEKLTFGVIAFYKAQAECIKRKLGDPFLKNAGDRLRIGTVDSFQGMEFDVVFLSLVRCERGYGFLQLYNRLNVSMSRQKRLLVAVGDAAFYDTDDAKEKVPGLADFLKLCHDKGVKL